MYRVIGILYICMVVVCIDRIYRQGGRIKINSLYSLQAHNISFIRMNECFFEEQAGAELGQAQLKLDLVFTSVYFYQINELATAFLSKSQPFKVSFGLLYLCSVVGSGCQSSQ